MLKLWELYNQICTYQKHLVRMTCNFKTELIRKSHTDKYIKSLDSNKISKITYYKVTQCNSEKLKSKQMQFFVG